MNPFGGLHFSLLGVNCLQPRPLQLPFHSREKSHKFMVVFFIFMKINRFFLQMNFYFSFICIFKLFNNLFVFFLAGDVSLPSEPGL